MKLPNPPAPEKILARSIAKRKDGVEAFLKQDPPNQELAKSYADEVALLEEFLPSSSDAALGAEELAQLVERKVKELSAAGSSAMGSVMKALRAELTEAQVNGQTLAAAVKKALS